MPPPRATVSLSFLTESCSSASHIMQGTQSCCLDEGSIEIQVAWPMHKKVGTLSGVPYSSKPSWYPVTYTLSSKQPPVIQNLLNILPYKSENTKIRLKNKFRFSGYSFSYQAYKCITQCEFVAPDRKQPLLRVLPGIFSNIVWEDL